MGGAQGVLPSPFNAAQTGMPPSEPSGSPRDLLSYWGPRVLPLHL